MASSSQPTESESSKKIVILGGSFSGVSTAHYLLKHCIPKLPSPSTYQIVLVSASTEAMCRQGCPRGLISDEFFPGGKLFANVASHFTNYPAESFQFVHGKAITLDHENRIVTVKLGGKSDATDKKEEISFHALVIATGSSTPSPLLGLNVDSEFLRDSWATFRQALPSAKKIVIAGGGPAGIETAGELGEYLNGRGQARSGSTPKVEITVITAAVKILPILRESIAQKAERFLADVGVKIIKSAKVVGVTPEGAGTVDVACKGGVKVKLEDGRELEADIYIPAVGMAPNTTFVDKSLLLADGKIKTNPSTLRVEYAGPKIYAIGDVTNAGRPAVHNIMAQVPVLCSNIKRDLLLEAGVAEANVPKERTFVEDTREMQLVPIGTSKGVGAAVGWSLPSILVWAIKGRDYWLWILGGMWSGKQWNKES